MSIQEAALYGDLVLALRDYAAERLASMTPARISTSSSAPGCSRRKSSSMARHRGRDLARAAGRGQSDSQRVRRRSLRRLRLPDLPDATRRD